jgi:arylsulfatase A-like enzyme
MIVVTADHGEASNQHGQYMHHSTAYDEMIQVPFVFAPPAGATLGRGRVSEPVALIDLAPTVAELFGLALPDVDGESLVASLRSPETAPKRRLLFAEAGDVVAVIDGEQKFILNRSAVPPYQDKAELYDLAKDPDERVNLVAENTETVQRLGSAAQHFLGTAPVDYRIQNAAKAFDPKLQGQLEALGYIDAPEPEASPR